MTKQQFLDELALHLSSLPQKEIDESLSFYNEMLDDMLETGENEEEAVATLDPPSAIAREIMLNIPLPTLIKSRCTPKRVLRGWEILLLVLGAPLWLSLLILVTGTVLTIYAFIWTANLSLWTIDIAIVGAAAGFLIVCVTTLFTSFASAVMYLGAAFVALALGVIMCIALLFATKYFVKLSWLILKLIKNILIGKQIKKEAVA